MLFANPNATRTPYPASLQALMSIRRANESRQWLSHWPQLRATGTPLHNLPDLAAELGVGQVLLKDESVRSALGSFKALGAPIALVHLILRTFPALGFSAAGLFAGRHATQLGDFSVISATDGNHGRALAAAAQSIGCRCIIVLHAQVSVEREQAIAAHGAQIVRIEGNYDASVAHAAALAQANGWQVVSDTSYDGYEQIPGDVMQGYGTLVAELAEPGERAPTFTHVFLQGGVGGLAAGVVSYLWELHGEGRPTFIVIEPEQADCLLQSAMAGQARAASGSVDSLMAGLACGQASPLAWRFLQPSVDFFMTLEDVDAVAAMRRLARGSARDIPLLAGESAVAGLAGLTRLLAQPGLATQVGLGRDSRVLLISTEGATAPSLYAELVGETAASVLARQQAWG
ncbi:diaminopropionate ammonia-lyase [Pseudomonas sp. BW13M1]|uniref:Diaminopropionate ammonia-lyase n=1 Tax=Pseudomonas peradeniyensis TaxID=2745488 RepID=A0A923JZI3_9PSED|nr:diaminopropionate ammonia-lyase [Pseudomonas peradeniyensis]MBV4503963.1 diaminopropionate ammonia-lyase [Pseudomonas peradeniyensis]